MYTTKSRFLFTLIDKKYMAKGLGARKEKKKKRKDQEEKGKK